MINSWLRIYVKLFAAEAKELLRNRLSTFFTIGMPLIFLFVFGSAGGSQKQAASGSIFPGNSQSEYFLFVMPAMLALGMVNLSLFGTTLTLASARERGLLRHYMLLPLPLSALLAAQVSVRVIMALIQASTVLLAAMLHYNVALKGGIFELLCVYLFCAAALFTCAYALAGLVKSFAVANTMVTLINFYIMAFGQVFTNVKGKPLEWLIYTTPVSSVTDLLRQVCLGQWANLSVSANFAILAGWMLLAYVVGIRKFHFLPE